MATSRRTGTNEQISTYGAGGFGRDYTVLATWETATDNNLVSLAESEVLECYDDAASFNDSVNVGGATTDASYFRIIRPAGTIGTGSWEGHDGTPNNGVKFHNQAGSTSSFDFGGEGYSGIQDLIIEMTNPDSANTIALQLDGGNNLAVGIIMVDVTSASADARGMRVDAGGIAVNCIGIRTDNWNFNTSSGTGGFYNCTSIDAGGNGFDYAGGTIVAKNCLSTGSGTADMEAGTYAAATTNNATGDASAVGTSPRINQTFTFVNTGADNYHLTSTDAGARTFGADLSADAFFAFDDDIDGNLRS
jgi:hypothetical protein